MIRPTDIEVRRGTLDDLPALRSLWGDAGLAVAELERRVTEFQVAVDRAGQVIGCVGISVAPKNGWIHSEIYANRQIAAEVRPLMWERAQTLGRNHGLVRVWIDREDRFWVDAGFRSPTPEQLQQLPGSFGSASANWLVFALRDESLAASVDREFELFKQAQHDVHARTLRRARNLRLIALLVAIVTVVLVVFAIWFTMERLSVR